MCRVTPPRTRSRRRIASSPASCTRTSPDGDGSAEKFKDVSRAYEVLSNPEKRDLYDRGVDPSAPGGGGAGFGAGFGFQDIFETFFGAAQGASAQRGPVPRARRGQDALVRLDLDLPEAVFGAHRELTVETAVVCPTCSGSCCRPGTSPRTCEVCGGRGEVQRVARSFLGQVMTTSPCAACHGLRHRDPRPLPGVLGRGAGAQPPDPERRRAGGRGDRHPDPAHRPGRGRSRAAARPVTCTSRSASASTRCSSARATTCTARSSCR